MRLKPLLCGLAIICWPTISIASAQTPIVPVTTIVPAGAPRAGQTIDFDLRSVHDPGCPYEVATSLGTGPIKIGGLRLALSPGPLFLLSVSGLASDTFESYRGHLDERGTAKCRLHLPRTTAIQGLRLHTAFVTLNRGARKPVRSVSGTVSFTIVQ